MHFRMRFTALFLILSFLHAGAKGYSQKISLNKENAPLSEILNEINRQSGYLYSITSEASKKATPITIHVKSVTLDEVLKICFINQPLIYRIKDNIIIISELTESSSTNGNVDQMRLLDVRGVIYNESLEPVIATITVKGSKLSTTSNAAGEFELKGVDENSVLIITGVNIEATEWNVNGKSSLVISVKTKIVVGEEVRIVNTGYQLAKPNEINGAVEVITNKEINQQNGAFILDRINGLSAATLFDTKRVSSVTNKKLGISIRGQSTINGPEDPLIIIDNFPYEGSINNINPNDVESITILKDAAAASIWGTKAGNGVIVITTKRGRFNEELKIEVNTNVNVTEEPDLFSLRNMSSSDLVDVELFLFSKQYRFSDTSNNSRPPFSPVYETLFKRRRGVISAADSATQINSFRFTDVRNEYEKYMYRKSVNQQYAINLRGGSKTVSWFFSAGIDKNINQLDYKYKRISIRSENNFKITKDLELSAGIVYTNSRSTVGKPGYNEIQTSIGSLPQYTMFADANGKPIPIAKDYRQIYLDTAGNGKLLNWNYYPLEEYKLVNNVSQLQDILVKAGLRYRFLKYFSLDARLQYETQSTDGEIYYDPKSYFSRNLINRYTNLSSSNVSTRYPIPVGGILDMTGEKVTSNNVRAQINFDRYWSRHSISFIGGIENREVKIAGSRDRTYGYNKNILSFSNVDLVNRYPLYMTGSLAFIPNIENYEDKVSRFVSFYGNLSYTLDNKYSVSASARRDGSNLFGASTNNKWKPLWSTGFSWVISNEKYFPRSILSYLRARITYGYSGNIDQSMSAVTTIIYTGNNPYTGTPYSSVNNVYNPDLRWEQVGTLNFGIDLKDKSGRISANIDIYRKKAKDLLGSVPIDATAGLARSVITKNIGELRTYGFDITINTLNIDKAIKWSSSILLSANKNKVTSYNFNSSASGAFGGGKTVAQGRPVWGLYSLKWAGLDPLNGDPQGYLNGQVSKNYSQLISTGTLISDLIYHGTDVPTFYGSFNNTVTWKNISINAMVLYRLGYYFKRNSISYSNLFANSQGNLDYVNRWQKPGDELITNVPSLTYPASSNRDLFYNSSEVLIKRADNIRLHQLGLSYMVSKQVFKWLPFDRTEIYFNVNNLGIIWKANKEDIDPDNQGVLTGKRYSFGLRTLF